MNSNMIEIQVFSTACIKGEDAILLYGQYTNGTINSVEVIVDDVLLTSSMDICKDRPDFCIQIFGKHPTDFIDRYCTLRFDNNYSVNDLHLKFPFEKITEIGPNIISTLCKHYNHRLDEWINYNFKLGFDAIIIFNNEKNMRNGLNEKENDFEDMQKVTNKYKNVFLIDFPYEAFHGEHWNNIQRISLTIGCNAFRKKCRYIALFDADEFVYTPRKQNIREFLLQYDNTFAVQSNILTNESNDDIIDNNILSLCTYVGENKYTKVFLRTAEMSHNEFIISPHDHLSKKTLEKNEIIHYHCWVNGRYRFDEGMQQINFLVEKTP